MMAEWAFDIGVGLDYCIVFDERRYSVPCALIQQRVDVRATAMTVEICTTANVSPPTCAPSDERLADDQS